MGRKLLSRPGSLTKASKQNQQEKDLRRRRRWRIKRIKKKDIDSTRKKDEVLVKTPPVKPVSILRNGNQVKKSKIDSDQKAVKRVSILHNGKIEFPSDYSDPSTAKDISLLHNKTEVEKRLNCSERFEIPETWMSVGRFFQNEVQQDKPTGFFEQLDFSDDDSMDYKSAASIAKDHSVGVSLVIELPEEPEHCDSDGDSTDSIIDGGSAKRIYSERSEIPETSTTVGGLFQNEEQEDKLPGFFEQLDSSDDDSMDYKSAASIAKDHSVGVSQVIVLPDAPEHFESDGDSTYSIIDGDSAKKIYSKMSDILKTSITVGGLFQNKEQQDKPPDFFEQLDFSDDDTTDYKSAASIAKDHSVGVSLAIELPEEPEHFYSDGDSTDSINNVDFASSSFHSSKSFVDEAKEDLNGLIKQIEGFFNSLIKQIEGFFNKKQTKDISTDFFQQFDFTDDDEAQDSCSTASSMTKDHSAVMPQVIKLLETPKHVLNTNRPITPATVATSVSTNDESKVYLDSSQTTVAISYCSKESYCDEEIGVEHTLDDLCSTLAKMKEMEADNRIEEIILRQMDVLRQMMAELNQRLDERKCLQDWKELQQNKAEIQLQEEFLNWSFLQSMDDESTIGGLVNTSCDKETEEKIFEDERTFEKEGFEKGISFESGESLGASESFEDCGRSESLEVGAMEYFLPDRSMGNDFKSIEDNELEEAVPSESVFSRMFGALEDIVLSFSSHGGKDMSKCVPFADEGKDKSKRVRFVEGDEPFNEREYEYYNDDDEYNDDEIDDEEEDEAFKSQYISLHNIQSTMRLKETEALEVDGGAPEDKTEDVTDEGYISINSSGDTERVVFSDIQPEGSNQTILLQSRDKNPLKTVDWEKDLIEAQYSRQENSGVFGGNGQSQSTLYVKPVMEELAENYFGVTALTIVLSDSWQGQSPSTFYVKPVMEELAEDHFGVTESTIVVSDSWQGQSSTNAETREDQSAARYGTTRMAQGALEGQRLTAEEKMEHARTAIDKGDWPHRSSRIYGETNIGAGESEMLATTASNDSWLKATLEWENFSSLPFRSTSFGASFPSDELHSVPSDEV